MSEISTATRPQLKVNTIKVQRPEEFIEAAAEFLLDFSPRYQLAQLEQAFESGAVSDDELSAIIEEMERVSGQIKRENPRHLPRAKIENGHGPFYVTFVPTALQQLMGQEYFPNLMSLIVRHGVSSSIITNICEHGSHGIGVLDKKEKKASKVLKQLMPYVQGDFGYLLPETQRSVGIAQKRNFLVGVKSTETPDIVFLGNPDVLDFYRAFYRA